MVDFSLNSFSRYLGFIAPGELNDFLCCIFAFKILYLFIVFLLWGRASFNRVGGYLFYMCEKYLFCCLDILDICFKFTRFTDFFMQFSNRFY